MSTTTTPTIINNWGEVKQKLFFGDKEIVNATKKIVPGAKAEVLQYTTREGVIKKFYFAEDVTILDVQGMRLKKQALTDLMNRFMLKEISADDMARAVAELG